MVSKCCCCISLRTGSLIMASLGIVIAALQFSAAYQELEAPNESIQKSQFRIYVFSYYISYGSWYLLSNGSLLFGALKYNEKAVLAYLVGAAVSNLWEIVFGIICLLNRNPFQDIEEALMFGFVLIGLVFVVCSWICNLSFYKELKKEKRQLSRLNDYPFDLIEYNLLNIKHIKL